MRNLKLSAGFTLIETLIVVFFLGIIATSGLPALNSMLRDARLRGAASEVVTALEYAQLTAMTSGCAIEVLIDASSNRIDVSQYKTNADLFGGGDELSENPVEDGSYKIMPHPQKKGHNYKIMLANEDRFNGVDITASNFISGTEVSFDSMGAPSKGGSVTLAFGNKQIVVTVDALTGKVSVSE